MNDSDYIVPARSWAEIREVSDSLRSRFLPNGTALFPIMELLERVLDHRLDWLRFEVGFKEEMGTAEGLTCPKGSFIRLREDVYDRAWLGKGRDRFTAAHELGHWILHTNIPLARSTRGDGTPQYCLAEPQANQFAAELLMPLSFIKLTDTEDDLMKRHGVSRIAAKNRLKYARKIQI